MFILQRIPTYTGLCAVGGIFPFRSKLIQVLIFMSVMGLLIVLLVCSAVYMMRPLQMGMNCHLRKFLGHEHLRWGN